MAGEPPSASTVERVREISSAFRRKGDSVGWWEKNFVTLVFNPSTVQRLSHVLLGCAAVGAFLVLSISSYYILKNRHVEFARHSFNGAIILALLSSVGLALNGHTQAQNVYKYQPAKLAAFEGHFHTGRADLGLVGWPNSRENRLDYEVSIPGGLSFMVFDDFTFSKPVVGLDRFKPEDRPPLVIPFLSWRMMVGLGGLMIVICGLGIYYNFKGVLATKRWLLWVFVFAIGFVMAANQAGWIAAEAGRQPWTVHPPIVWNDDGSDLVVGPDGTYQYDETLGLRTVNSISGAVSVSEAATSLILFVLLYLSLAAVWIMVLDRKIRTGPEPVDDTVDHSGEGIRAAAIDRQHARLSDSAEASQGGAS